MTTDQNTQSRRCIQCGESFLARNLEAGHGFGTGRLQLYCTRRCIYQAYRDRHRRRVGGPSCKCGCGRTVAWNARKQRWYAYMPGHYRKDAPYKDAAWLRQRYADGRTAQEIADECGVSEHTILMRMHKYGIERRTHSEALLGQYVGPLNHQWRGGVAQWPYSPGWKALARRIRNRDQWTCQDCGEQRKRWGIHLHVHHIDGDKRNDDPANLTSLCATCHRARHRRENLAEFDDGPEESLN